MKFHEISRDVVEFLQIDPNFGFVSSLECQAAQPLLFVMEYQGFVTVSGGLKTQNIMIFIRNDGFLGNFMNFHQFPWLPCISQDFGPAALVRKKDSNSYAFSMVAVLIFLPGHSKISFSMKILVPNPFSRDYHEIRWNFLEILVKILFFTLKSRKHLEISWNSWIFFWKFN